MAAIQVQGAPATVTDHARKRHQWSDGSRTSTTASMVLARSVSLQMMLVQGVGECGDAGPHLGAVIHGACNNG